MSKEHEVLVIGAGIIGLSSAYHILQRHHGLDVHVIDMFEAAGRGNTTRSAAAFRDMFTNPLNRKLAQGAIAFYEELQERKGNIGLRRIGYLWLMTEEQFSRNREPLDYMAHTGVIFDVMDRFDLERHLHGFKAGGVVRGVLGSRCGILNQNGLTDFYYKDASRMGATFSFGSRATGLLQDADGNIIGAKVGQTELKGKTVVVAAGAWAGELMRMAGADVPVVPKKRQLFSVKAKGEGLKRLYAAKGFNAHGLLPFTIVPGGAYLRPAANSFIMGYADDDRRPGIEDKPRAERDFYDKQVLPRVASYFPAFDGAVPEQSWAGHYGYNPRDNIPFVARVKGAIVVGGDSGSGIMKADSIGRGAAGLYADRKQVELGDGSYVKVADLGLDRKAEREEFII